MTSTDDLRSNETLMAHFIMKAPPPSVPYEVNARGMHEGLRLKALKPDYDLILSELEKIGDGWHLRDEHTDSALRQKTKSILEGSRTSIWHFMRGGEPIGFCCAVKKGFGGELVRIANRFNQATEREEDRVNVNKGAEIYKVGLYRRFIGQGYGHNFLPAVQAALLNGQQEVEAEKIPAISPSEFIYLNTRLTNKVDSRHFYSVLGYDWAGEERWPISVSELRGLRTAVQELPALPVKKRPLVQAASFATSPTAARLG